MVAVVRDTRSVRDALVWSSARASMSSSSGHGLCDAYTCLPHKPNKHPSNEAADDPSDSILGKPSIEVAWASTRQRPFGLTLATRLDDETCSTLAPVDGAGSPAAGEDKRVLHEFTGKGPRLGPIATGTVSSSPWRQRRRCSVAGGQRNRRLFGSPAARGDSRKASASPSLLPIARAGKVDLAKVSTEVVDLEVEDFEICAVA
uniref:Uncharacterized protein n=1 Tax=Oryza rufipogon TaxID=4529 RepID=A0A0E0NA35_ORYRU